MDSMVFEEFHMGSMVMDGIHMDSTILEFSSRIRPGIHLEWVKFTEIIQICANKNHGMIHDIQLEFYMESRSKKHPLGFRLAFSAFLSSGFWHFSHIYSSTTTQSYLNWPRNKMSKKYEKNNICCLSFFLY